jgi:hypothetical protein
MAPNLRHLRQYLRPGGFFFYDVSVKISRELIRSEYSTAFVACPLVLNLQFQVVV